MCVISNVAQCMELAKPKPFTLQEAAPFAVVWQEVQIIHLDTKQAVIESLSTSQDPWSFVRDHEAFKRLSVSPQEVKNALKEQLFRFFNTKLSTDTPPYTDAAWKWVRVMIAVCAMADAKLPENYRSDFGFDDTTPLDVAKRQSDQLLVQLLEAQATKSAKM